MINSDGLRLFLDSLPDTVFLCTDDGIIYDCNNQSLELLGYCREELIGQPIEMLVSLHQRNNHVHHRNAYFRAPRRRLMNNRMDLTAQRKDGSAQPVSIALSPVELDKRQIIIVSIRDNSEHVANIQRERDDYVRALEQQRLENFGRFSCGIAHDFKNLLTVVVGYVELLMNELPQHHPLHAHVLAIGNSAGHLADLSNQILRFAGGHSSARRLVAINGTVTEIVELLKVSLPGCISIKCELSGSQPTLLADPTQITQILLNLILNAGEAIGERAGTITIVTGTRVVDQSLASICGSSHEIMPGKHHFIEVCDDGPGISQDCMDRMLDPFFTTKVGGKGLGLSVVASIVKNHGGWLTVSSSPGQGATFTVYFAQ